MDDRSSFVWTNYLCYGCLCPGHRTRFCRNRILCKRCSKNHPTSLHGYVYKPEDKKSNTLDETGDSTSSAQAQSTEVPTEGNKVDPKVTQIHGVTLMTGSNSANKSSLILPVWISHRDNPDNELLIYALLDTQSDTTFVIDDTCQALGVEGLKTQLILSTIFARNQVIDSNRV